MDELEIRHALRQYVSSEEPPSSVTADGLLARGRRQQRWRLGFSVGASSAATAIAIVGGLALTPLVSGTAGLGDQDCEVPLAVNWTPALTTSTEPDQPTPTPTSPDAPSPTEPASPDPELSATLSPPEPTSYPSMFPSLGPSEVAGTPTPTPIGQHPLSEARMREASCYFVGKLKSLLPDATYARLVNWPSPMPPLSFYHAMFFLPNTPNTISSSAAHAYVSHTYCAGAIIIEAGQDHWFTICVTPPMRQPFLRANDWRFALPMTRNGQLAEMRFPPAVNAHEIYTEHSAITIGAPETLLDVEQVRDLAGAPELDLFR